jgi:hypothetical protein
MADYNLFVDKVMVCTNILYKDYQLDALAPFENMVSKIHTTWR